MKNFKHLIPAILIASLGLDCYPQNLIANGSFEDANTCTESDAECAPEAWKTTSPFLLVYGGLSNKSVAFTVFNPSVPNTRKYLQIKLLCPLVKDKLYRFSLRLVPGSMQIESIGVLFSDSIIFYDQDILIKIKPTIDLSSQMLKILKRRKREWNQFTVEYRALGFEKYLIIGNFQSDAEQIRTFVDKPKNFTNYLYGIDDVELIPIDSIDLCPDYEKIKEKLYSLNDRHPLKRYNLFGDDEPKKATETEVKPIIDTIRLSSILFEFDSFKINSAGKQLLDSLFYSLNKENIDFIKIHGHTDSIGDQDYNIRLSLNRANAIKEYLSTQNLSTYITEIQGYGDKFPLESNLSENGRQKNRRVEVIIKYKEINR
jgi:outer membrane protein OmpA-like peptidoglycan-associated protein